MGFLRGLWRKLSGEEERERREKEEKIRIEQEIKRQEIKRKKIEREKEEKIRIERERFYKKCKEETEIVKDMRERSLRELESIRKR